MSIAATGNLIEALLWFLLSVICAIQVIRAKPQGRITLAILSTSFFVFAVSDLIESESGAWWRPWWLLLLKGICVAGFVVGFGWHYLLIRPKAQQRADSRRSRNFDESEEGG